MVFETAAETQTTVTYLNTFDPKEQENHSRWKLRDGLCKS